MSRHDDDPVDLTRVAADDEAVEALLRPRAVSPERAPRADEDDSDDRALALLRDLLADVGRDVPQETAGPALRVAGGRPSRRVLRRSTAVAAVTAGVLSLSGVAAATTLAPVGSPLHAVGEAVRSAAGAVADAVAPPAADVARPPAPRPAASPTASPNAVVPERAAPAATTAAPAPRPSAADERARSAASAAAVAKALDAAELALDAGRPDQAASRLDAADRRLPQVLPADGAAALRARLDALRARVAAAPERTKAPAGAQPEQRATKRAEPPAREKASKQPPAKADKGRDAAPKKD